MSKKARDPSVFWYFSYNLNDEITTEAGDVCSSSQWKSGVWYFSYHLNSEMV